MLKNLGRGLAPVMAVRGDISLNSAVPACVFDLDATVKQSYDGSGNFWHNIVRKPADGAAQDDYTFTIYSGVNFIGNAGDKDAHFIVATDSGTNRFAITNGNTPFLSKLCSGVAGHPRPFTMAIAFKNPPTSYRPGLNIFGGGSNNENVPSFWRMRCATGSLATGFAITDKNATSSVMLPRHPVLVNGGTYLWVFTMDAKGAWRSWLNGAQISGNLGLSNMEDLTFDVHIFRNALEHSVLYGASMFNTLLDAPKELALRKAYEARHGRSYSV